MLQLASLVATHEYWQPVEQAEHERRARMAALVAEAPRSDRAETAHPTTRRAFIPRIARALGLV